jgi:hypothetical protein
MGDHVVTVVIPSAAKRSSPIPPSYRLGATPTWGPLRDKTVKTHLDGYNFMPFFKGETDKGPRREFFYFDDNSHLNALRYDQWKIHFAWIEGHLQRQANERERTAGHQPAAGSVRADTNGGPYSTEFGGHDGLLKEL